MQAVTDLCVAHPVFQQSQHIACYLQNDNEMNCAGIIAAIWAANKTCYLPLLAAEEKRLAFAPYHVSDFLYPNKYGILEPCAANRIPVVDLDLVIVPLVGFDLQGHRLGMGGGYYDRTFEFLLGDNRAKKPYLLGLAFEDQKVSSLPFETWDVCLNGVLTEKKWLTFI